MSECFVYVTLPGQEAAVTAGRFALDAGRDGVPVGRFVYGRRYLERDDAVELDPVEHALLAGDRHWQLALAYDLTPNPQVSIERRDLALTVGDFGRAATAQNLLSQATRFGLRPGDAAALVEAMREMVQAQWLATVRAAGVSETDCDRIAGAFVYQGFQQETESP